MAFIFDRSSKIASVSSSESDVIVEFIYGSVKDIYESVRGEELMLDAEEEFAFTETISFYVRKTAHFTVFALLGANAAALLAVMPKSPFSYRQKIAIPIIFGALYAFSDELHQYFVPGRSMELRDMIIDVCGVAAGIAAIRIFCRLAILKKDRAA